MRSVYVTGTDTGIGKTMASVALLLALRAQGVRAVGMKPVASGCERVDGAWHNEDALALQAASAGTPAYAQVNPFAFPAPTAPELAAAAVGIEVSIAPIVAAHAALAAQAEVVMVEGVGGWLAPLSTTLDQSALVHALGLPVILVVGLRLGCINHARLTARAIDADGAHLIGWIANHVDPQLAHADETRRIIARHLPVPCLGYVPHQGDGDAAIIHDLRIEGLLPRHG